MPFLRSLVVVASFVGVTLSASAQLLPAYLPAQCASTASKAIEGATDGRVVGIVALGVAIPLGGADINIGMSMDDGRSPLWAYLVRSDAMDTMAISPLIRFLNSCTKPPVDGLDGALGDMEGIGLATLPTTFVQGAELVGAVKANADYQKWAVAHPDSAPSVSILTTSVEDVFGIPAGTAFWAVTWFAQDEGLPFVCIVHSATAQTVCIGEDVVSVDDKGDDGLFAISPNPSSGSVIVRLPENWSGRTVAIDAVDMNGQSVSLRPSSATSMTQLYLNTSHLTPGLWALRITDGQVVSTMMLTVLR